MPATIKITSIEDQNDGSFTAHVTIEADGIGEIPIALEVEAASYGEVPRVVSRILVDLGNAIAIAAQRA